MFNKSTLDRLSRSVPPEMGFSLTRKIPGTPGSLEIPNLGTVDGWNPAPPGMHETLINNGIFTISTGAGFSSINRKDHFLGRTLSLPECSYLGSGNSLKPWGVKEITYIYHKNQISIYQTWIRSGKLSHAKKKTPTFHYTGCFFFVIPNNGLLWSLYIWVV